MTTEQKEQKETAGPTLAELRDAVAKVALSANGGDTAEQAAARTAKASNAIGSLLDFYVHALDDAERRARGREAALTQRATVAEGLVASLTKQVAEWRSGDAECDLYHRGDGDALRDELSRVRVLNEQMKADLAYAHAELRELKKERIVG